MTPPRGSERFRPWDRLRHSRDYRRVSGHGRRWADGTVVMLLAEAEDSTDVSGAHRRAPRSRLGITVSRKVGRAVVRNRVKRTIREHFRRHRHDFPAGDIVVIARPSAGTASPLVLRRDLASAAARMRGSP